MRSRNSSIGQVLLTEQDYRQSDIRAENAANLFQTEPNEMVGFEGLRPNKYTPRDLYAENEIHHTLRFTQQLNRQHQTTPVSKLSPLISMTPSASHTRNSSLKKAPKLQEKFKELKNMVIDGNIEEVCQKGQINSAKHQRSHTISSTNNNFARAWGSPREPKKITAGLSNIQSRDLKVITQNQPQKVIDENTSGTKNPMNRPKLELRSTESFKSPRNLKIGLKNIGSPKEMIGHPDIVISSPAVERNLIKVPDLVIEVSSPKMDNLVKKELNVAEQVKQVIISPIESPKRSTFFISNYFSE